jgi:hypothetical protein
VTNVTDFRREALAKRLGFKLDYSVRGITIHALKGKTVE